MAPSKPAYVAKVKGLATFQSSPSDDNIKVGRDVIERIQSCLRRATHPHTPEAEAQTALRMASRLMEKHNVSQARMIAAEVDTEESQYRGGQSIVNVSKAVPAPKKITSAWLDKSASALCNLVGEGISFEIWRRVLEKAVKIAEPSEKVNDKVWLNHIEGRVMLPHTCDRMLVYDVVQAFRRAEPSKSVRGETWSDTLSSAMTEFFDCKSYTVAESTSRDWVFYGIGVNTVAAAMSFEMAFNLVEHWASSLKRGKPSYRLGVADGMWNIACEEKENELRRAQEQEGVKAAAAQQARAMDGNEVRSQQEADRPISATQPGQRDDIEDSQKADRQVKCEETEDVSVKLETVEEDTENPFRLAHFAMHDEFVDDKDEAMKNAANAYDDGSDDDGAYPGLSSTFVTTEEKPIDLSLDLDEDLRQHMPQHTTPKPEPISEPLSKHDGDIGTDRVQRDADKESGVLWRDSGALVRYRKDSNKIADDFFKAQNLKMKYDRERTAHARDLNAYRKGREDSKKIDVKQRRIQGTEDEET